MPVNNNKPLTKKDFIAGLGDFFEQVLVPYFKKHVEKRFDEVENRLGKVENRLGQVEGHLISMDRKLNLVAEKTTDQERKIARLEQVTAST